MSSLERRLERVGEAISGRNSGCTCDENGSWIVIRFVGSGDPVQEPSGSRDRKQLGLQHPPRLRFERFDRTCGAWIEHDLKG